MTDVDGPPVPVLRFSSLLIRGAETADFAGTDEQALKVNCNMAQAFEIPGETGQRILAPPRWAEVGHRKVPSNAFQIAAPGPILDRIGIWNMGLPPGRCKRKETAWRDPRPARFPARLSGPRLIVSVRF